MDLLKQSKKGLIIIGVLFFAVTNRADSAIDQASQEDYVIVSPADGLTITVRAIPQDISTEQKPAIVAATNPYADNNFKILSLSSY